MPNENEIEIENPPVPLTDEALAFVSRLEGERSEQPRRYVNTDRFSAEQGVLYTNIAIG